MAVSIFEEGSAVGRLVPTTLSSCGTVNSTVSSYVTATHKQLGPVVMTTLTIASLPQTVVNGTEYVGTKLWTFPSGRILILNAEMSLAQKTTSILADTLNASSTGALAIGSAAASNVALTSTMANILPSTAFTSSATINVAGTAAEAELDANNDGAEIVNLDGTSTAIPVYLNCGYATTLDIDADATQNWTGTIYIKWLYHSGSTAL